MKLIVDSGSTKTTWLVRRPESSDIRVDSIGLNPVRDSEDVIRQVVDGVAASLATYLAVPSASSCTHDTVISAVHFYGAGCIEPYSAVVREVLAKAFPEAQVTVDSDLLCAARAVLGHEEGIACILGTGSNSCLYDGERIVANVSPLGWILGDEGSGAVLGRTLVGDLLKGQLPSELREEFLERFNLTPTAIIDAVYRQPLPNRFLASLVPFLVDHRADEGIHALIINSFRSFFRRNVAAYERRDLPVSFVGGIAKQFESELREAAAAEGFEVGHIEQAPILGVCRYHDA